MDPMTIAETGPEGAPTFDRLHKCGVIPVVTIDRVEDALPLGEALLAGGIPCAEVTFRTAAAPAALNALAGALPHLLVGAGTVVTVEQARTAIDSGGRFVVSPGYDEDIVQWCLARDVPVLPGVMTPTEVMRAVRTGLDAVKFFPAEPAGGATALEAIGAAFPSVRFVPTGGIGPENLGSYLRLPAVIACGGSWLVSRGLIGAGDFGQITQLAGEAVQLVREVRGE